MGRSRATVRSLLAALALSALALPARATRLEIECARLTPEERDELAARGQLLIGSSRRDQSPERIAIACDEEGAWLDCSRPTCMDRLAIDERAGLLEGALDALEQLFVELRRAGARDGGDDGPSFEANPRSSRNETPGGVGLGVMAEIVPDRGLALGPRLDIGFGAGAFSGFATEGFRIVTSGGDGLMLIDTQLGLAWGAPFAPAFDFGVGAAVGIEWLTTSTAGGDASAGNTDESVIGSLSARGRLRIGAAALWLGADLRARAAPQSLGSPVDVELPPVSVLVSAGALWLVAGAPD